MLAGAGLAPHRQLGQCFLIDQNLLRKIIELAEMDAGQTVLEVGPGTGTLTGELLRRAGRVVAVEIDHGLADLLRGRLGDRPNFTLLETDVLAGKHAISPAVLTELSATGQVGPAGEPSADATPRVCLVSNLPYNVATPLLMECLLSSWRAQRRTNAMGPQAAAAQTSQPAGASEASPRGQGEYPDVLFERLTFTVQREVADRLCAPPGGKDYGPVSVLAALLGRLVAGAALPPTAFWPVPKVASRMARIDLDPAAADRLADADTLVALLGAAFGQRRKQIGSLLRRKDLPWDAQAVAAALDQAGIDRSLRAEVVMPEQFLAAANLLARP